MSSSLMLLLELWCKASKFRSNMVWCAHMGRHFGEFYGIAELKSFQDKKQVEGPPKGVLYVGMMLLHVGIGFHSTPLVCIMEWRLHLQLSAPKFFFPSLFWNPLIALELNK